MERNEGKRRKKERGKEKKGREKEGVKEVGVPTVGTHWTKSKVQRFDEGLHFKRKGFFVLWFTSSLWAIVLGLILELCCAILMVWDGFVAGLKGCYRSEFGLKLHLQEFPKCSCNPRARYCVDWRNSVAPSVLQFWTIISFSSEL